MTLVVAGALAKGWLANLAMMAGQGTVLAVIAILLVRAGRLRPAWQAAIWLVVAAKLALPWSPALPWSLSDLIAAWSDRDVAAAVPPGASAIGGAEAPSVWPALGWLALLMIWLVGAVIVVARASSAQRRAVRAARRAPPAPAAAQVVLRELAPRGRVAVVVGDAAVGPHVVGFVRAIIVVPPVLLDEPALLRAVLVHELAHVRRCDALGRLVQIVAGALMWWWPVARVVLRRLELAREAACDAAALEACALPRPAYARLLVRMAALQAPAASGLAAPRALDARVAAVLGPPVRVGIGTGYRVVLAGWALLALGGARPASAHGHVEVCQYTPALAEALFLAYPEADLDGNGELSREEACDLQAELRLNPNSSRLAPEAELATLLAEPLCCNCDEADVYSSPKTCSNVEGVAR